MIIVSQNKDNIINFDNVGNVNIEKCYNESLEQEDFTYDIFVYIISSGLVRLGKYKTEKRAKEVFDEIVEATTLKQLNGAKLSKEQYDMIIEAMQFNIYEMPEE